MPDTIRKRCGQETHPWRGRFGQACIVAALPFTSKAACAEPRPTLRPVTDYIDAFTALEGHELAALALTLGVILFAVATAIALVRTRTRAAQRLAARQAEINELREERDRANALLLAEPQVIVVWPAGGDDPDISGDVSLIMRTPLARRVLAFGTWLEPEKAHAMEDAVDALRAEGRGFSLTLTTLQQRHVAVEGRAIGGRAVLRIKDLTGTKSELAELAADHQQLRRDIDTVGRLLEALPAPVWARDATGRLTWVNAAYARAVEARDGSDAVARNLEVLDSAAREGASQAREAGAFYEARLPVIVAGTRRILQVIDRPSPGGSAGIGIDVTEVEAMRAEVARMTEAHRRTLDQLSTAVAMYSAEQRLTFYNAAFRVLWGLEPAFLDSGPSDSAVLDRLRAARKLPEQADFRNWKSELHDAYRAMEPRQHEWYLPDGRTLRVVTTPNPEGGVTYLFDDVTASLDLERRFDRANRMQRETLDSLAEAVAVFGSNGRAQLFNPAFARMWELSAEALSEHPHITAVEQWCKPLYDDAANWQVLREAITGIENRAAVRLKLERKDGSVLDCTTMPLPDGATMLTFQDITDTENIERALRERNEALEAADQMKVDFVHHVSYELRSPLTNIIGFADLLTDSSTGPLLPKQAEYLGYITTSTKALFALINNILDLATIDAGAMTLELGPVDLRDTIAAAAEGIQDRLKTERIELKVDAPADIGGFIGDENRVKQVLYNLLANAVGFSPHDAVVTVTARRTDRSVVVAVSDSGPGIPPEVKDKVFDWFESHSNGSRHRGAGLGLSLVRSFVELHGGKVHVDSIPGRGTTVTCEFPVDQAHRNAAE
ncbi:MAG: hypothetical protein QOF14_2828 [Hyphomicrobiales bacterium]|nr:hypothetical protein [Hyphomicrobiales bacterium]